MWVNMRVEQSLTALVYLCGLSRSSQLHPRVHPRPHRPSARTPVPRCRCDSFFPTRRFSCPTTRDLRCGNALPRLVAARSERPFAATAGSQEDVEHGVRGAARHDVSPFNIKAPYHWQDSIALHA